MSSSTELAATILLLRDGSTGPEVFMVVRHHQIDFAGGAMVFPGGKISPADRDPALRDLCTGAAELDDDALAVRVGAIREAFEESGLLLARRCDADSPLDAAEAPRLGAAYRSDLAAGRISLAEVAVRERLAVALDELVPFAHWITPEVMPKRYDTHFFLAAAPPDQLALHDGTESVDSAWVAPDAALAEAAAGRRTIIFPTRMNLAKLARAGSVAEAVARATREPIVTVLPQLDAAAGVLRIPAAAGYDVTEATFDDLLAGATADIRSRARPS